MFSNTAWIEATKVAVRALERMTGGGESFINFAEECCNEVRKNKGMDGNVPESYSVTMDELDEIEEKPVQVPSYQDYDDPTALIPATVINSHSALSVHILPAFNEDLFNWLVDDSLSMMKRGAVRFLIISYKHLLNPEMVKLINATLIRKVTEKWEGNVLVYTMTANIFSNVHFAITYENMTLLDWDSSVNLEMTSDGIISWATGILTTSPIYFDEDKKSYATAGLLHPWSA